VSRDNVEIVKEFSALFESGDRASWRRHFDEDVIWDTSQSDLLMAGLYHGHDGVERFFSDWLSTWDEFKIEHREWIDAGDHVVVAFHQRGRGKGSGIVIDRDFFGVYDLRDGKVIRYRAFESRKAALEAAGID
jgi:ketosteroid isomerase-like protein